MRGVTPAHRLLHTGVNCSLSTNNVLNRSRRRRLLAHRMATSTQYCQVGAREDVAPVST